MEFNKKQVKSILFIVFVSILFYFFVKEFGRLPQVFKVIWDLTSVFIMGGAAAFVLNVPMKFIERKLLKNVKKANIRRLSAVLLTLAAVLLVIYLVLFIVVPEIAVTLQKIILQFQELYKNLPQIIDYIFRSLPVAEEALKSLEIEWSGITSTVIKTLQSAVSSIINSSTGIIGGVIGTITQTLMSFIFCLYILFSKEKLALALKKLLYAVLKEGIADDVIAVMKLTNKTFSNFLSGQCLEAVILGSLFVVSMTVFGMPYAVLIGVLIAVTALIPIVGAFIGCGVGVFLIMMINPVQAVWFAVLFIVLQQIEGNAIYPKVVGNSVGLPPILVFAAVILGGNVLGVGGMLLSIPLTSVCFVIIKKVVENKLIEKEIPPEKYE